MKFLKSSLLIRFMINMLPKKLFSMKSLIQSLKMYLRAIMVLYSHMVKQVQVKLTQSVVYQKTQCTRVLCPDRLKQSSNQ